MEVGLIDGQALRIGLRDKLRLTGYGPYVFRILWFTEAHVVVATYGVTEGLVVDIRGNVEIHRAAHVFNHETVASWGSGLEVDIPDVSTHEVLLASLFIGFGSLLPELHRTYALLLLGLGIIKIYLTTFPCLIITLTTVAQPLIEVGGMDRLCRRIADDIDMNGLRQLIPDVEGNGSRLLVGADACGDVDRIAAALLHRLGQLEEEPVVYLTRQRVVCVHGL